MYHLVIVENDAEQSDIVKSMIDRFPQKESFVTTCFSNASDFVSYVENDGMVDILLMDIDLGPGESGVEIVQEFFPPKCGTEVIYLTGHIEYCTQVYRTNHTYFLVKPVNQDDFDDALMKALHNLSVSVDRPIYVQSGTRVITVSPKRIRYIESDRRKIRIHAGGDPIETYASLSDIAADLPSLFIRCHKSFLVNMDYIAELQKDSLLMLSGEEIPISQRNRSAVKQAFLAFLQAS